MLDTEKITKAFEAAGERMNGIDGDLDVLKKNVEQLVGQLKKYGRSILTASADTGGYRGFWGSEGQAKEFGELVMRAAGIATKDMGSDTNVGGGALVPDELAAWIIQKLGKYGKFRKHATTVKMGSGTQYVPKVTADLTIYCPEQGGEITKSDMSFGLVGMNAKKFACLTAINRELDEDSVVGLGEIIGISITRSMAKKEDLIAFLGDGTSTYFGMTGICPTLKAIDANPANIPGLVVASGNLWSEITLADFEGVVAALPEDADEDAVWFMSKKFYYTVVHPLARAAGVANIFDILSSRKERSLLGYPVEFVSAMPTAEANSQVCAILGDLSLGAFLAERRALEIAKSTEVLFSNDQIAIRGTERIDIAVYGEGDTTDAGVICGMVTAAS